MEKIKATQRIPTTTYGYVELQMEYDTPQEAIDHHSELVAMYQDGTGLPAREWTKVRRKMLETGECDPELIEQMNKAQRYFINQTKLTLRDIEGGEVMERHHSLVNKQ